MHGDGRYGSIRAAAGDGAFFAVLPGGFAKVVSQEADKEGKRLRWAFMPSSRGQVEGAIGYGTVGIIESGLSPDRGLFMEENCEDRSKTDYR